MTTNNISTESNTTGTAATPIRLHLIDAIRAITIISMIGYHYCFDYFILFGHNKGFTRLTGSVLWQNSICCSFILISGFVFTYGKKKIIRRGLLVNFFGLIITAVTLIVMPEEQIWFGILNLIGCSMLITYLYDRFLIQKLGYNTGNHITSLIFWLIIFIITKYIPNGYIGTHWHVFCMLPDKLYTNIFLIPFGFPTPDFVSGDYFPIIPWLFLYFCGYHLNKILADNTVFLKLNKREIPIFSKLGKHSLFIYLIHQPICYVIAMIISNSGVNR